MNLEFNSQSYSLINQALTYPEPAAKEARQQLRALYPNDKMAVKFTKIFRNTHFDDQHKTLLPAFCKQMRNEFSHLDSSHLVAPFIYQILLGTNKQNESAVYLFKLLHNNLEKIPYCQGTHKPLVEIYNKYLREENISPETQIALNFAKFEFSRLVSHEEADTLLPLIESLLNTPHLPEIYRLFIKYSQAALLSDQGKALEAEEILRELLSNSNIPFRGEVMYRLGNLYLLGGENLTQDVTQASNWFTQALDQPDLCRATYLCIKNCLLTLYSQSRQPFIPFAEALLKELDEYSKFIEENELNAIKWQIHFNTLLGFARSDIYVATGELSRSNLITQLRNNPATPLDLIESLHHFA